MPYIFGTFMFQIVKNYFFNKLCLKTVFSKGLIFEDLGFKGYGKNVHIF